MNTKALCKMIKEALVDESKAVPFYKKMAQHKSSLAKKVANSIADDEAKHHKMLGILQKSYCGRFK